MVNYYETLRVSPDASSREIKSAYRRLARRKHPDVNDGDAAASREFARIAKAYKVLSDPKERAEYDKARLRKRFSDKNSVFNSDNPHAQRIRQMAYERRYNAIIDRMIEDERRESMALQKVIFPVVALFLSTGFVAMFKPHFWSSSNAIGKIVLLTLFIVGLLHLLKRLQAGFERYTYSKHDIHDSVLKEIEEDTRPYSRTTAIWFLAGGVTASLAIGLLVGSVLGLSTSEYVSRFFSGSLNPEFIFYPPIIVLLVDIMHSFVTRFDH